MSRLKVWISLSMCCVMVLGLVGCGKTDTSSEESKYRQEYVKEEETVFVDTDGDFEYKTVDFKITDKYVIIYPEGNTENKNSAEYLSEYYKEKLSLELTVISDTASEQENEILIGKTNRNESGKELNENELVAEIKGKKFVLLGGHNTTTDSAVKKLVRLEPSKDKAFTFSLETDFVSTALDGYEYVWGDEFEGTSLDRTKFSLQEHMTGSGTMVVSGDEDVVSVSDGRLKMIAKRYYDPQRDGTQYKVPKSVSTVYNMNFSYGYAEIRARVPFQFGAWPSFWSKSNQSPYLDANACDYTIEVDIFEIFGNLTEVEPNLHKWYRLQNYDYDTKHNVEAGNHTQFPEKDKNIYQFQQSSKLSYEYHTYGMEWTPTKISMFVDGEKYHTFDLTKTFDLNSDMSGFKNQPLFLIFNNHLMPEDGDYVTTIIKNEELPTEYFIDYLRLYQKPGQGKLYIDETVKD